MRQLGQLEAMVMQHLWSVGNPVSVREMRETLTEERELAYTTVMTVMDNLHSDQGKDGLFKAKILGW